MSEEIKTAWDAIIVAGILGGIIGSLLTVLCNHRLTIWRDRRAGINSEKSRFIPLIEQYIVGATKGEGLGFIRYDAQQNLFQPAMRFRLLIKGSKLKSFNDAWNKFYTTTREEVGNFQPGDSDEKKEMMKQTILLRLEVLKKTIQES